MDKMEILLLTFDEFSWTFLSKNSAFVMNFCGHLLDEFSWTFLVNFHRHFF